MTRVVGALPPGGTSTPARTRLEMLCGTRCRGRTLIYRVRAAWFQSLPLVGPQLPLAPVPLAPMSPRLVKSKLPQKGPRGADQLDDSADYLRPFDLQYYQDHHNRFNNRNT